MNKQLLAQMQARIAAKRDAYDRSRSGIRIEYLPTDLEHQEFQRMLAVERVIF